jgi:mannose-6-phosphate isomerase
MRQRVWGGSRLATLIPGAGPVAGPVGEAWIVWDGCRVASGPWAGRTLADVTAAEPAALLGAAGVAQADGRFPVLVKIIDTTDWLSLQVHPDDATAARLEGPGHLGKTESWYVLDAAPGAQLIVGTVPGVSDAEVRDAIRDATLDGLAARVAVHAGDALLVPAGLLHSIGPGILLYELQQSSDLTYRVSDWGRPASTARPLHPAQSIESIRPSAGARPAPVTVADDGRTTAVACEKFVADLIGVRDAPAGMDTDGRSFHAITALTDGLVAEGDGWSELLARYASLVVPATSGRYAIRAAGGAARAMVARVP